MILLMLVSAVIFTACGEKENVPGKVKTAFSQKFPNAKKVDWDKENGSEWEAEFRMNGKKYSANFDADGNWKETEYKIKKSEIPAAVSSTLENEYSGYEIEEAEISETPEGKFVEVEIENDDQEMEILFDMTGNVVKKEAEEEDEDDD